MLNNIGNTNQTAPQRPVLPTQHINGCLQVQLCSKDHHGLEPELPAETAIQAPPTEAFRARVWEFMVWGEGGHVFILFLNGFYPVCAGWHASISAQWIPIADYQHRSRRSRTMQTYPMVNLFMKLPIVTFFRSWTQSLLIHVRQMHTCSFRVIKWNYISVM